MSTNGILYKATGLILAVIFIYLGLHVSYWWVPVYGLGVGCVGLAVGILLFGVGQIISIISDIKDSIVSANGEDGESE